jgi:hypothetical protein
MNQTRKYHLPQSVKNQVSAATFANDIRGHLNQLVNPNNGKKRGPIKAIMKTNTYPVHEYTSDFPRSSFVSDENNYNEAAHTVGKFRFTKAGVPVSRYFSKLYSSTKGGSKKRSYKKSGKKSHKKSHRRRH